MVIDVHCHPAFYEEVCPDEQTAEIRRQSMAYYKTPRCASERILEHLTAAGVDKCVLLPHDYSAHGGDFIAAEAMSSLVKAGNGRFYGFVSVEPESDTALGTLEKAFENLNLAGLKLNPAKQKFYPQDEKIYPIYERCIYYNKPIMFHSGFSWEPGAETKYAYPMNFEQVAVKFPKLRFCLAHMGFPWVKDTAVLLLKYPNMYADTAALYFDSAGEFYEHIFKKEMSIGWLDRSLRHQVMFGSNIPRWEQMRMLKALKRLGLREETETLILYKNALEFLGEEKADWLS